jgi:hypothetical protein
MIAKSKSKIANISSNSKTNSKSLKILSMRLGKSPFLKNQRRKISLDCPFNWVGLDIFEMKEKTLVSDFKLMLQFFRGFAQSMP